MRRFRHERQFSIELKGRKVEILVQIDTPKFIVNSAAFQDNGQELTPSQYESLELTHERLSALWYGYGERSRK